MKQFCVKTKDGHEVNFNFPTSISEISEEYLKEVTDAITVADNYSLIALCYSEKLSTMILTSRTAKQNAKIKVTPIFVKAGSNGIPFIQNAKMKQRVVSTQSQISLGTHVIMPYHKLTIDYFAKVVKNSASNTIYEEELAKEKSSSIYQECIFIEFKVIPNSDIMGFLDIDVPELDNNPVTVNYTAITGVE